MFATTPPSAAYDMAPQRAESAVRWRALVGVLFNRYSEEFGCVRDNVDIETNLANYSFSVRESFAHNCSDHRSVLFRHPDSKSYAYQGPRIRMAALSRVHQHAPFLLVRPSG